MDNVNHKHLINLFQKQFFEKSSKKCVLSLDANKTIIMKASCVNFSFSINEQMVKKMSISKIDNFNSTLSGVQVLLSCLSLHV